MRIVPILFALLLFSAILVAQQRPIWERVYTFDESFIDMNTREIVRIGPSAGRVKFRWTFSEPETYDRDQRIKYKTRLEVIDFDCRENKFRPYDIAFLDTRGKVVAYEANFWLSDWSVGGTFGSSTMLACELINPPPPEPPESRDSLEMKKVASFALAFTNELDRVKDFKPIISRFFASTYLDGYVRDQAAKWSLNLDEATAARATRSDLERYYIAFMNTGYLTSMYVISHYQPSDKIPGDHLFPAVEQVIKSHPYTATYGHGQANFDYLEEKIDSLERLRSYTDLLEKIGAQLRPQIRKMGPPSSDGNRTSVEEWLDSYDMFKPSVSSCAKQCPGLPSETRLFTVKVPIFELQIAEIGGQLKVISARNYF